MGHQVLDIKMEIDTDQPSVVNITTKKELPENYHEIYACYKAKDYNKCLSFIDAVKEEHIEYQILKSACFIHSGTKVSESHKILDHVLEKNPENPYTIYAKGLAFYHEEKYSESLVYFEKARKLDTSSNMERAEVMMEKAQSKITESERQIQRRDSMLQQRTNQHSSRIIRRFGCELCNHFFGKKFNLDRHNRSIHKRATPVNFLTNPSVKTSSSPSTLTTSPVKVQVQNIKKEEPSSPIKREIKNERPNKRFPMSNSLMKKGRVRCGICKKMFKRGSIARHIIIHSGNKSHKCNECDMAFFQKSDLTRHEVS